MILSFFPVPQSLVAGAHKWVLGVGIQKSWGQLAVSAGP